MGVAQTLCTRLGAYIRPCLQSPCLQSPWLRRLIISVALFGAVLLWVEPQAIVAEVQRLSAGWVALALAISTLQIMLCAWRWQFTARLIDVPLRFSYALREYYLALLVNQLLPGGVLGDAGRAHRHASQAQSRSRAWRAVIIERASGQLAVAVLTLTALLFSPMWHNALGVTVLTAVGLSVVGLAMIIAIGLLQRQRLSNWLSRMPHWSQAFAGDLKRGLLRRGVWPQQLLSSLVIVLSYGFVMVCAARAIGVALPALQVLALAPVLLLAMLIPFSVAGWGLREGTAAGVWMLVGLPPAQGVAVSMAYGVLVLLASLPGIWVALNRRQKAQPSSGGIPQPHVEQRVVTTAEDSRGRAQRTLERLDGRHFKSWPAGADQQRGDQQVQPVNGPRFDKLRNRDAAALYQYPRQAFIGEQGDDILRVELPAGIQRQHAALNMGRRDRWRSFRPYYQQRRGGIITHQRQVGWYTPPRIENHPRRMVATNMAHGQLRVIGASGTRTDHHCVDQRAEAVQMDQTFVSINVVGVAAFRRNAAIHTLSQLSHDPGRATGQRGQTIEQLARLSADRLGGLPLAVGRQGDCYIARALMTQPQQPFPGIGQCNNVDMGVGHGASALKNSLHHAGLTWSRASWSRTSWARKNSSEQTHNIPHARKPGGLYVQD